MPQLQMKKTPVKIVSEFKELFTPSWRYIIFYGGRSSGKSHAVGQSLLLRGREKKLRILCTREIQNTIKDSVHKLLSDLIERYEFKDYEVKNDTIVNKITGTEFIFKGLRLNINEIKSTEGIDICWIEEGQSITQQSLDVLTPTIRKKGSQIIVTFNRYDELDPVYTSLVLNPKPNSFVKKVNYDVLESRGLLPDVIKLEIEADRSNPDLFAHKWLGEPISQKEFSIINRVQAVEAMQRNIEPDGAIEIGVDVARMGNDRTVFWKRHGLKTVAFKDYTKLRTTEICDLLEEFAEFNKETLIKVDDTGVGGGVTDEMMKREYNVVAVNFGGVPNDKEKYPNWISEAWFNLSEIIEQIQLPNEPDLLMELTTRQWKMDIKGKRKVEGKDEYKRRGFRSPDLADACIICYSKPVDLGIMAFYKDKTSE